MVLEILKAILMGIVEGITEWLPISSTGHMILLEQLVQFDASEEFISMFRVVIQLGAILAVVVLFWDKLWPFGVRHGRLTSKPAVWSLWIKVVVATLPVLIISPLDDWMEEKFYNYITVAAMLILYGVLFILLENSRLVANPSIQKVSRISLKTAFFIGLFQLLSLVPGTSRSGATILGAMILGCSRGAAAEFSFFLGVPVMFGASLLKLVKYFLDGNGFSGPQVFYLIFGMVVAFGVSVYSIKFLMSYVRRNDFKFFGYYRIILGVIVLSYFGITALAG